MIRFSNEHSFEYMVPSGTVGFDAKGWLWEKPLIALGLMKPELFTIVLRTLTLEPRLYPVSNLSWIRPWTWLPWSPYSCVQFLPNGGAINKVGLWNPGIKRWYMGIAPRIDFRRLRVVASISGKREELVEMAEILNDFVDLVGIEVNVSCPNTGHMDADLEVIESIRAVKKVSCHPIIAKLSVDQNYVKISAEICGYAEAISLNSVPFNHAFPVVPPEKSPMAKIGKPGSGSGGVSGKPAQGLNWQAVKLLAKYGHIPVIAPSIMEYEDLAKVRRLGAKAVSFGAIHLRTPWKPTAIVEREMRMDIEEALDRTG